MRKKRVLLLHISNVTGHRSASLAIEEALRDLDNTVQITNINAFNYMHPILEKLVISLYMFIIKDFSRVWEYLYDNEKILRKVKGIRTLIHRHNDKKIKQLLDRFSPDIIVCTQAFPCGMVADYKAWHNLKVPLVGVLTDYVPHGYWLNDFVDLYAVPHRVIEEKLIAKGIRKELITVSGIPVESKFRTTDNNEDIFRRLGLDAKVPVILIMGGGQGLGPIKQVVRVIDKIEQALQMVVVCGMNKSLFNWLNRNKPLFTKNIFVTGYIKNINELMSIASFIVTKPGGLTSAEALSKSLPIVIVSPLPGQESCNTQFLLREGVALKADKVEELPALVKELLNDPEKLGKMREKAAGLARPDSALEIAKLILIPDSINAESGGN